MNPSELNSSSLSQLKYKVVLLGDSGVGKSSIIDRFVKGEIDLQNQVPLLPPSPPSASTSSPGTSFTTVPPPTLRKDLQAAALGHRRPGEVQESGPSLPQGCSLRYPGLRGA